MLRETFWAPLVRPMPRLVPGRIQLNEARDDDVLRRAGPGLHPQDVGEPGGLTGRGRWTDAAAEGARGKDLRCAPSQRCDPSRRPTLTRRHSGDGKCSCVRRHLVGARRTRPTRNMAGRQARGRQLARREWRCERRERQQHETVYRQLRENPAPGHVRAYAMRNSNRGARTCRSRKSGSIAIRAQSCGGQRESCPPTGYVIVWWRHRPTFV